MRRSSASSTPYRVASLLSIFLEGARLLNSTSHRYEAEHPISLASSRSVSLRSPRRVLNRTLSSLMGFNQKGGDKTILAPS